MKHEFLRKFYSGEGLSNVAYDTPVGTLGAGGAAIANNGLSIAGGTTIQLGGPDGAATAANLLNNREIPLVGFNLKFSGIGSTAAAGSSVFILKADPTKAINAPFIQLQDSSGADLLDINSWGLDSANAMNIFIGTGLSPSITGAAIRNVIIGRKSGVGLTSGTRNVGVGNFVWGSTLSGSNNTAVGNAAEAALTTGGQNTGVGLQAVNSLTIGTNNSGFGSNALLANITGTDNTAIGAAALGETTIATSNFIQNTAVGSGAGQQNTGGNNNVFIGFQNMFNLAWGASNVTIGALSFNAGGTFGSNNTTLGANQQITASGTFGNGNIWIGQGITTTTVSLANNTSIGVGMTSQLNNICQIGRSDQNIILGNTAPTTDNGSKVQHIGGISLPLRSSAVNTNLTFGADHTLILTAGGLTIGLPALAAGANGVFCIVNQSTASTTGTNYVNKSGASVNTIAANSALWLQANGATNYQQIN